MNEKLTPEQLWKMCEEYHEDNCEYFNGDRWVNLDCAVLVLNKALTAHAAEDERHDCIKHLRQLGWNVTEPAEYDGLTGKYLKGDLSKANPVAIKPKTEDEPSRIKDYDGYIFSIDKLPRKIANHITLRKIWEFRDKNNDNPLVRLVCNLMEIWLQQEDK